MSTHGIIYKDPMIWAKKEGIKTVTRRPIKPPFEIHANGFITRPGKYERLRPYGCPYGKAGDLLYAKESFQILADMPFERSVHIRYQADEEDRWIQLTNREWEKFQQWKQPYGKKSSLFLFKSLARFWDEIVTIKVERIQDITESEARNEGLYREWDGTNYWFLDYSRQDTMYQSAKRSFQTLWHSMYAGTEFAWENNPWVWVIEYRPVDTEKMVMKEELRNMGIL